MTNIDYNESYERAMLGILLLDNTLIDICRGRLQPEYFYTPKCKLIYKTILEQYENTKTVNILTLTSSLNNLDRVYIATLTDDVPTTTNWEFYVRKLTEYYLTRSVKADLDKIKSQVTPENIYGTISDLNSTVANYLQHNGSNGAEIQNLCMTVPKKMEEIYKNPSLYAGFSCGYKQIDDILDGFQGKKLYVIGARPSIGKTAFATCLLANFCKNNIRSSIFSLEMSAESIFYRMLSAESHLPLWNLLHGQCIGYRDGLTKLNIGLTSLYKMPLNIMDTDIEDENILYSKIRYEVTVKGSKVILIDHLGLIEPKDRSIQRYEQVGRITKNLHKLCKELDCAIILLCQMGREAEGKKPNMALLRESGNIEQDADVIMFLYRERDTSGEDIPTEVIIEKNRDGKIGSANMLFKGAFTKFVEKQPEETYEQKAV